MTPITTIVLLTIKPRVVITAASIKSTRNQAAHQTNTSIRMVAKFAVICIAFLGSPPGLHRSWEQRSNDTLQQSVAPMATRLHSQRSITLSYLQVRRAVTPLHVQGLLEPAGRAGDGPGLQRW